MINVIVFSKNWKRAIFNQLSGGNLDGDRYFISYNDYIINNVKDTNCKPLKDLKYSEKNNKNIKKIKNMKITIKDSIKCMIKITSKNLVSKTCDNHLSFADGSILKAKDQNYIKLCKYFNQEIIASKTGNFIDLFKKTDGIEERKILIL